MNSATLKISIEVDDKGSVKIRQLGKEAHDAGDEGDKGFRKMGQSLGDLDTGIGRTLGSIQGLYAAIAGTAAVTALTQVSMAAIKAASDMEETQNNFNVAFQGLTQQAEQWSSTLRESFNMSEEGSKRYLSSIQGLLVPTGIAREEAGRMSFQFVKLAADLGSFKNLPTEQVIEDIQSALQGSSETMAKYGINVKEAKIQQEALTLGLARSKDEITDQDRAQALLSIALREGADAIGDVARSAGSYAYEQRRLQANVQDFTVTLGNELLPLASDVLGWFNEWYRANEDLLAQDVAGWVRGIVEATRGIGEEATPYVTGLATALGTLYDALKKVQDAGGPSVAEMGIVGYAVFGKSGPGRIIASVIALNELLGHYSLNIGNLKDSYQGLLEPLQNMADVMSGKRDWWTGELAQEFSDLDGVLGELSGTFGEFAGAAETSQGKAQEAVKKTTQVHEEATRKIADSEQKKREKIEAEIDKMFAVEEKAAKEEIDLNRRKIDQYIKDAEGYTDFWQAQHANRYDVLSRAYDAEEQLTGEHTGEMVNYWEDFSESTKDVLHDFVESGIKMEFDSIGEAAQSLTDAIVSMFADMVAKIIANWAASGIMGLLSGQGLGGFTMPSFSLGGSGSTAGTVASVAGTGYQLATGNSLTGSIGSAIASYLGGGGATVTYGVTAGQTLGSTAAAGGAAGAGGAAATGTPTLTASSSTGAATGSMAGVAAAFAVPAAAYVLSNLPQWLDDRQYTHYQTSQGGAISVMDRDGDPVEDLYRGLDSLNTQFRDSLEVIDSYNNGIGSNRASLEEYELAMRDLDMALEQSGGYMDVLANQFGDGMASMALALDGTLPSTDSFIDALAGFDVSMSQSSNMLDLAKAAAQGNATAMDQLNAAFYSLGLGGSEAKAATMAMISAVNQFSDTNLNLDATAKLRVEVEGSTVNRTVADISGSAFASSSGWLSQARGNNYGEHWDGAIFLNRTMFRPGHTVAERGAEAVLPLHQGKDTLKLMDDKLDQIVSRPITIKVVVPVQQTIDGVKRETIIEETIQVLANRVGAGEQVLARGRAVELPA